VCENNKEKKKKKKKKKKKRKKRKIKKKEKEREREHGNLTVSHPVSRRNRPPNPPAYESFRAH
jgi:hypothetical protein